MIVRPPFPTPAAGALLAANNLSDIASVETAMRNLGIYPRINTRAINKALYLDGTTVGGRAFIALGTAGDGIGAVGQPFCVLKRVFIPAVAGTKGIWVIASNNGSGGFAGNAMQCYLHTTDVLRVDLSDASAANRRYISTNSGIVSRFAGQWVVIAIVYDGSTTKPAVYINGTLEATTEFTAGTAPAWNAGFNDDFIYDGSLSSSGTWLGAMEPAILINAVLSGAEVLAHAQTGRLPLWCDLATGNMAGQVITNWSNAGGGFSYETLDGITANGFHAIESAGGYGEANSTTVAIRGGRRYEITYDLTLTSGAAPWLTNKGGGSVQVQLTPGTGVKKIFESSREGTQWAIYSTVATEFTIANIVIREIGPIAKTIIQPGAMIGTDAGDNALAMVLVIGAVSLGEKPAIVEIPIPAVAADGFLHLDQIIVPTGYELFSAVVERTAGASTGTITIKETSSGGTTVASGALGSTPTSMTLSNVFSAAGKKLHLSNSSWSSSTLKGRLLFRRYQ